MNVNVILYSALSFKNSSALDALVISKRVILLFIHQKTERLRKVSIKLSGTEFRSRWASAGKRPLSVNGKSDARKVKTAATSRTQVTSSLKSRNWSWTAPVMLLM